MKICEVKICGLRSVADAEATRIAGARYAGINFVTGRRRCVDPTLAPAIVEALGPVIGVGVFLDQPLGEIMDRCAESGLRWAQLHGAESPEMCAELQAGGLNVIKALPVNESFTPALAATFSACERLLLDASLPGSGQRVDLARLLGVQQPFILAGGLNSENVAAVIAEARPAGVDTASGIEVNGRPDPIRIAAFCRAAQEIR